MKINKKITSLFLIACMSINLTGCVVYKNEFRTLSDLTQEEKEEAVYKIEKSINKLSNDDDDFFVKDMTINVLEKVKDLFQD